MSSSMSEAALKLEIARLSGAIDRFKNATTNQPRSNIYINPDYKPPARQGVPATSTGPSQQPNRADASTSNVREVVLGGVAFQSSRRKLVRADLPKPVPSKPTNASTADFSRSSTGHLLSAGRVYKPKSSRGRPRRPTNRNMTLTNNRRPYQSRRPQRKYSDKPCPRFTTTGTCTRGLTCMYQHDPAKIAICWNFLQGQCPNSAETCNLSHEPTPERTPLCMHFANNGRCTRDNCLFPHVRVGARQGICRDFAVLGYCERGLDCDKQHVRECPDFAENGTCSTKGCKLPHVIRANRTRKTVTTTPVTGGPSLGKDVASASNTSSGTTAGTDNDSSLQQVSAEDAQLGDEFISLTFLEDESEDEDEDEEEESDDNANDDDEARE